MADEDSFGPFAKDLLPPAAAFVRAALAAGGTVYVHCSQGVSRSATAVLWVLLGQQQQAQRAV